MRLGNKKVVLSLSLVCLLLASGCTNAIREGILLGTSGGFNTAISSFLADLFAEVTEPLFEEEESGGAGGPP